MIGQRWKELESTQATYYKEKAGQDMARYKSEMEVYTKNTTNNNSNNLLRSSSANATTGSSGSSKSVKRGKATIGLGGEEEER
jgi:hypothetical protein